LKLFEMRLLRLLMNSTRGPPPGTPLGPPRKGGKPAETNHSHNKLTGLTWSEMKHHYSVIPMWGLTIIAVAMAGTYVYRLASKHPEVSWTKKNSEPWNDYRNQQYKFRNVNDRDYSNSSPPKTSFSK